MSVRMSWRMTTATMVRDAAPAAGEADAAEDDRRDAEQRVRAGDRRADAGAGGQAQAAEGREQARQRVVDDLRPSRPRRRCGTPPGGCCRSRRSTARAGTGGAGSRSPRRRRSGRPRPGGATRCRASRPTMSLSHSAAPPPGASTSRAQPAQTNDMARVTTMSGHAGHHDDGAVDGPEHQPKQQDADKTRTPTSSAGPS